MEERQEQLLESILEELQKFNARFHNELERAEDERTIQATKDSNDAQIFAEEQQKAIEKEEQEAQLKQERFDEITAYFEEQIQNSENLELKLGEMTHLLDSSEITESNQEFQQNVLVGFWLVILCILCTTISQMFFSNLTKSWR